MIYLNRKSVKILFGIFLCGLISLLFNYSYAENESFIKPGTYERAIVIEKITQKPELAPLGEALIKNKITIYTQHQFDKASLSFNTTYQGNKFIVTMYYKPAFTAVNDKKYVGRYIFYTKDKNVPASEFTIRDIDFVNSFIKWMFENAWGKR
jgi:hypothetical protein